MIDYFIHSIDMDLERLPEEEESDFSDALWELAAKERTRAVALDDYFERRGIY